MPRISVRDPDGPGRIIAETDLDNSGWIVSYSNTSFRHWFPYSGGSWELRTDGTVGQQLEGTGQTRAPRDPRRMRRFLGG